MAKLRPFPKPSIRSPSRREPGAGSREPGAGSRLLLVCRKDAEGERFADRVSSRVGPCVTPVYGWNALIAAFYPVPPALVILDAGLLSADNRVLAQVESLSTEVPGLPITVVGNFSTIPPGTLLKLGNLGVHELTRIEDLSVDRIRGVASWTVESRVLLRLRADCNRPVPAVVADAIKYAMARRAERLSVEELATRVGHSSRWLRARLRRAGMPPPRRLITWGRLLWAVHDLCMGPDRSSDRVAWELGFSSSTVLGNALYRYLGVRIGTVREKGHDWAIARFVQETDLCEPGRSQAGSD